MAALQALLLASVLSAGGETVMLDFYSPTCGPCRTMEPRVEQLLAAGYPVRKIDISQHPEWADRYGVRLVPCFVMIADGREVDRVLGSTSYDWLVRMFEKAGFQPKASGTTQFAAAPAPPKLLSADRFTDSEERFDTQAKPRVTPVTFTSLSHGDGGRNSLTAEQRALAATVKLSVEDADGFSNGTGTIIDVHGDEALVLTCGHIFRDSQGKGRIRVQFFDKNSRGPVEGKMLAYDASRLDIGLVVIRPGFNVTTVQVAPPSYTPQPKARVFSVGCDRGADPSVRRSHITTVDRYAGPSNIEVAGMPCDGRSGGGLFSDDGLLVGVCNAAVPDDNEGIYASVRTIQDYLAENGLKPIYLRPETMVAESAPANSVVPIRPAHLDSPTSASLSNGQFASSVPLPVTSGDLEVICIVRSKNHPQGAPRAIVLDNPSEELLNQLRQRMGGEKLINDLDPNRVARNPSGNRGYDDGPTMRAQSPDR